MAGGVQVDVSQVQRVLRQFESRMKNIPMGAVAEALVTEIDDVIQSDGLKSASGQRWDPLTDETVARHPNRAGGMLLQATGLLANVQPQVRGNMAIAKSPAPYAGWFVTGTSRMVRRDFTDLDIPRLLAEISEDVLTEIVKG